MSRFKSFDELKRALEAAKSADDAFEMIDSVLVEVAAWDEATCRPWIVPLSAWILYGEGGFETTCTHLWRVRQSDDSATPTDVYERGLQLFEEVLTRMAALGLSLPEEVIEALEERATYPTTFDIPRRYLVRLYKLWIERDFVPGVAEYERQVAEKATPAECIEIADLIRTDEGEVSDYSANWVEIALPHAQRFKPEVIRDLIQHLHGWYGPEPGPYAEALLDYYEGWLHRLPSHGALADAVVQHFIASPLDRDRASEARRELDGADDESFQVSRSSLDAMLQRDLELLNPPLPRHFDATVHDSARRVLQSYRRLELTGDSGELVGCALLTVAIEAQLRWALSQGLPHADAARVQSCGLKKLARFVAGETVSELADLSISKPTDRSLVLSLARAGTIRNYVHHEPTRVRKSHRDDLRRAIFDSDKRAQDVMRLIACLEARPRTR